jgi:Uma2 family endonuclease
MSSVGLLPRTMTWSELEQLPEDGPRIELYDGEVWVMTAPTFVHQDVVLNTAIILREYADQVGGVAVVSPFDIVFSERNVVQPDVVFFVPERKDLVKPRVVTRYRPDLAVEILSPSTEGNDRGRKLRMFARYEVPEYWILDTESLTLEIRSLRGSFYEVTVTASGDDMVTSPLLPDLSFPLSRLFKNNLA